MCSRYLCVKSLLVCPIYDMLHVLQVSLYTSLLLQSGIFSGFLVLMLCCIVFVLLKSMFMFVCSKRLVIFLIFGPWYVNVAHFLFSSFVVLV